MTISNATVSGSGITTGNSASVPATGSTGSQTWTGLITGTTGNNYNVPANGTLSLIYQTNASSCAMPASYTNSATAHIGTSTAVGPATATLSIGCPTTTISYPGSPYCATGTASVVITGLTGGTFSSTAGLSLNTATGQINLSASTPGTYTVTYNFNNGICVVTTTTSVTINALPTASISYTSPACNTGTATVTRTGQAGGTYSSTSGLVINSSTGEINLASSTPGT